MKSLCIPLLFLSFLLRAQPLATPTPPPTAQPTPQPTPQPPPPAVTLQFAIYVWPTEGILLEDSRIAPLPRLFYNSPIGPRPIRLIRGGSTQLYPYSGHLPLQFYDVEEVWTDPPPDAPPGTAPTMERRQKNVIQTQIPASWTRALVILFPDKKAPDGSVLTMPIPYEMEELKPGMARIYNGSGSPLVLEFPDANNKLLQLPPFKNLDFTPENLTKATNSRIFVYGASAKGDLEMVHTSKLFFEKETTNYFFLYPQGPRRIRILRVAGHADVPSQISSPPAPPPQ